MRMKTRIFALLITIVLAVSLLAGCRSGNDKQVTAEQISTEAETAEQISTEAETEVQTAEAPETEDRTAVRFIVTSDIHGKMVPWRYDTNQEDTSGSLAQIASVVKEKRNENTVLIDVGDSIQDNSAELFLNEDVHPMIQGMNAIGYDVATIGNHEFNYGMDTVKKTISGIKAKVILSNVYDTDGKRLADPYVIKECGGIRIGFIGAVTPNITKWDKKNLEGCTVTDPAEEINKIVSEIEDKTDLIVGVLHMDKDNEFGTPGAGYIDIMNRCPKLDFICAGHGHREVAEDDQATIPVVENKNFGQTVIVSDINLEKKNGKWQVINTVTEAVKVSDYKADTKVADLLASYDGIAREDADMLIGRLEGGDLVDDSDIPGIPNKLIRDSELMDSKAFAFQYYSDADIITVNPCKLDEGLRQGEIRKSDITNIQKYTNELYVVKMTGRQLKKYMEWAAAYYKQTSPEDLTIAFSEDRALYTFTAFTGVNYEINVSKPEGERIENLTWPDGRCVKDDDMFTAAVSNYMYNTYLADIGEVFDDKNDLPELISAGNEKGDFKAIIIDYISNVKHGIVTPNTDNNWKITGFEVDKDTTEKISELVKQGKLTIEESGDGRRINIRPITEKMLKEAEK